MQGQVPDLENIMTEKNGAVPAVRTATVTGSGIDCADYDADMYGLQHVGTVSGTTPTLNGKWEESTTSGGTYTAIAGATHPEVTATGTDPHLRRFRRTMQFVRYVGTIAGTTPSFACSAALFGQKKTG